MNVAFDDWIPVVTTAGKRQLASLCEVLTDGEQFADLAVRPHERVALMRLFLCVAHAALDGPKDYDEWLRSSLTPARCGTAISGEVEGCVRVVSSREALVAGGGLESDAVRQGNGDTDDDDRMDTHVKNSVSRVQVAITRHFSITPAMSRESRRMRTA